MEVKDRPHVSRAVPLAAASVSEALADAGLDVRSMSRDELRRIGVIVGSGGITHSLRKPGEVARIAWVGVITQNGKRRIAPKIAVRWDGRLRGRAL